ncbi:MAG TPA: hypothetical protein VE869_14835, partial [Gemmatimonas sp.]|nr:hypothetical protein [Gemmatimonas sp.]
MNRFAKVTFAFVAVMLPSGCVQPAYERIVVYELDVSGQKAVTTVGVRGDDSPLSWRKDQPMTAVVPDS